MFLKSTLSFLQINQLVLKAEDVASRKYDEGLDMVEKVEAIAKVVMKMKQGKEVKEESTKSKTKGKHEKSKRKRGEEKDDDKV